MDLLFGAERMMMSERGPPPPHRGCASAQSEPTSAPGATTLTVGPLPGPHRPHPADPGTGGSCQQVAHGIADPVNQVARKGQHLVGGDRIAQPLVDLAVRLRSRRCWMVNIASDLMPVLMSVNSARPTTVNKTLCQELKSRFRNNQASPATGSTVAAGVSFLRS